MGELTQVNIYNEYLATDNAVQATLKNNVLQAVSGTDHYCKVLIEDMLTSLLRRCFSTVHCGKPIDWVHLVPTTTKSDVEILFWPVEKWVIVHSCLASGWHIYLEPLQGKCQVNFWMLEESPGTFVHILCGQTIPKFRSLDCKGVLIKCSNSCWYTPWNRWYNAGSWARAGSRVCKAPHECQKNWLRRPTFFLVVRLMLNNICTKFGVNRSMFTGGTLLF